MLSSTIDSHLSSQKDDVVFIVDPFQATNHNCVHFLCGWTTLATG